MFSFLFVLVVRPSIFVAQFVLKFYDLFVLEHVGL